ncbi:response regulator [Thermodesulfobacteriota bacterium]
MSNKHILIVEDERKIASLLKDYLVKAGYSVTCVERGDLATAEARRHSPALILLDIMLPAKDGMEVCREIRRSSNVPIIMITARVEEIDRVIGLELGADDYICKPFSPREVVARVKAVLRRAQPAQLESKFIIGPITLDSATRQVTVHGDEIVLTPTEFGVLKAMMASPNRVFSRGELISLAQGYSADGYERTIDSHVKNLRKKLAKRLPKQEIIATVYGVGYRLNVEADPG